MTIMEKVVGLGERGGGGGVGEEGRDEGASCGRKN